MFALCVAGKPTCWWFTVNCFRGSVSKSS